MPAVNPFAAAQAKAAVPGTPKAKQSEKNVVVPDDPEVRRAIDDFVMARAARKQAEALEASAKGVATPFAEDVYFRRFASDGSKPETMVFKGNKEAVKLVITDRGEDERYFITDAQLSILVELLGEEAVNECLMDYTKFSFDPTILAKPGVMDQLGACIKAMQDSGTLSPEEAGSLLTAKQVRTSKKGTIAKLAKLCGDDPEKMNQVFKALGSSASAYIM